MQDVRDRLATHTHVHYHTKSSHHSGADSHYHKPAAVAAGAATTQLPAHSLAPGRAGTPHGHAATRGLSAPPPWATLSRGPWLPTEQMAQGSGSRMAEGRRVGSEPPRDIILQPA